MCLVQLWKMNKMGNDFKKERMGESFMHEHKSKAPWRFFSLRDSFNFSCFAKTGILIIETCKSTTEQYVW